jgi:hypothetical protein
MLHTIGKDLEGRTARHLRPQLCAERARWCRLGRVRVSTRELLFLTAVPEIFALPYLVVNRKKILSGKTKILSRGKLMWNTYQSREVKCYAGCSRPFNV